MPKTIVGLYDDHPTAEKAVRELEQAGFGPDHLRTSSRGGGSESRYAVDADKMTPDYLTRQGVPADEADFYVEGVRRGGSLVVAHVQDQDAVAAAEIMARHAPLDYESQPEAPPEPERIQEVPEPEGVVVEEHSARVVEAPEQPGQEEVVETERVVEVADARETDVYGGAGGEDDGEAHLVSSVTVAEATDGPEFEDDLYLAADEGGYDEDEEEADVYEGAGDEDDAEGVAWLDLQDPAADLTETLVTALLDDLRERIARLERRADDQAERLARLEERAAFATERAENATALSAARLETQLIERLTRLEEHHRRGLPPEAPGDRPTT